ncbi:Fibulin-1 [Halotydeus destructor]|nr:Fibulin-1 [Halotydeus destructor]
MQLGMTMNFTFVILALVPLLVDLASSRSTRVKVSQILRECCDEGTKKDSLDMECSESYKRKPELRKLNGRCSRAFLKCCVIKQASLYCDKGISLAVQDGHCDAALRPSSWSEPGGLMLLNCCEQCVEGRSLDECPAEVGHTLPELAHHQCCEDYLNSTISIESREVDDVCSKCDHKCSASKDHCACFDGYQLAHDGHSCRDINECWVGDICGEGEQCVNYEGTYECILSLPFPDTMVMNAKTNKCEKVSSESSTAEPETTTEDPFHFNDRFDTRREQQDTPFEKRDDGRQETRQSDDAKGCPFGFEQDKLTAACLDVNECERGDYMCWEHEYCVNNNGAYTCEVIQCDKGMKVVDGQCEANQCPVGSHYDEIWEKCEDDDECLSNPCSRNEVCRNNVGSYICEPKENCPDGMRPNTYFQGCVDIDECQDNKDSCKSNETCVNTHGSFHCDCARGFEMKDGVCQDVNECSLAMPVCDSITSICINNHGSYECKCKPGFERDRFNPHQCNNINECLDLTTCPPEAACFDNQGSFRCICTNDLVLTKNNTCEPSCPVGLTLDGHLLVCVDIDECQDGEHACRENETCVNTLGSFHCDCARGFQIKDGGCQDVDECSSAKPVCNSMTSNCINTHGSYNCQCKPGFEVDSFTPNHCNQGLTNPISEPKHTELTVDVIATIRRGHIVKQVNLHRTNLLVSVSTYDGHNFTLV